MKTATKYMIAASLALTCLAGCGKEDTALELSDKEVSPVFTATIDGNHTRAYDTTWEKGNQIGITGGILTNAAYTTVEGDGLFTPGTGTQKYYFENDDEVTFTAYYPLGTPAKSGSYEGKISTFTGYGKDIKQTLANQKEFDFLWAEASGSKAAPDVKFKFAHQMSKITLVFKSENGVDVSNITKYDIAGLILRGTFDPLTGRCETIAGAKRNSASLTLSSYATGIKVKENEPAPPIIVFPQTLESESLALTVTATSAGIGTITGNLIFKDDKLEPGNNYQFVIKVSKTGLTVNKSTIKGWTEEDLGEKEAS